MSLINEMREYSNIKKLDESVETKTLDVEARMLNIFSNFSRDLQGIRRMMNGKDFYGYNGCRPCDGPDCDNEVLAMPDRTSLKKIAEEKMEIIRKEFEDIFKIAEKKEETNKDKEEEKKEEEKKEEEKKEETNKDKEEKKNENVNESFSPELYISSLLSEIKQMAKTKNPPKNRDTVLTYLKKVKPRKAFLENRNDSELVRLADKIVIEWRKA